MKLIKSLAFCGFSAILLTSCTTMDQRRAAMRGTSQPAPAPSVSYPAGTRPAEVQPRSLAQNPAHIEKLRRENDLRGKEDFQRRLEGRLDDLERQNLQLQQEVVGLRNGTDHQARAERDALKDRMSGLESQLVELDRNRKRENEQLLDRVSAVIAKAIPSENGAVTRPPKPMPSTEAPHKTYKYYYEHTIEPGQTLSHIAQTYGVSLSEIIRINKLANNGNLLKVGQVLSIPKTD